MNPSKMHVGCDTCILNTPALTLFFLQSVCRILLFGDFLHILLFFFSANLEIAGRFVRNRRRRKELTISTSV